MKTIITVECSRYTIDPEGIGSDADYEAAVAFLLDAVRDAFPGADVRRLGQGGRTGGMAGDGTDIGDDVRLVVERAFDDWSARGWR